MPLLVSATCVYSVTATGVPVASLVTAMAAANVPVDQDFLNLLGVTVTSDNTAAVGQQAVRTIVLDLTQPPFVSAFNTNPTPPGPPVNAAFRGTIRSTSANDDGNPVGTGARTVTINYKDTANVAQSNVGVVLNGLTKVSLATTDHSQITSIVILTRGADGGNDGNLIIEDDSGVCIGYAPASIYTKCIPFAGASTVVQTDMFGAWMQKKIQGSIYLPVTAVLPVVLA